MAAMTFPGWLSTRVPTRITSSATFPPVWQRLIRRGQVGLRQLRRDDFAGQLRRLSRRRSTSANWKQPCERFQLFPLEEAQDPKQQGEHTNDRRTADQESDHGRKGRYRCT